MNKKFSTLLVGALLASGLFNAAYADTFKDASKAAAGQYYTVQIGSRTLSGQFTVKEVTLANGVKAYQLIDEDGAVLSVKDGEITYDTFADNDSKLVFLGSTKGLDSAGKLTDTPEDYDLKAVSAKSLDADNLNAYLGEGFSLQICKQVIKSDGTIDDKKAPVEYSSLKGDVFSEILFAQDGTDGVILRQNDKDGKQIVLLKEQWGSLSNSLAKDGGYKFAAVTNTELKELRKNEKIRAEEFMISIPATVSEEPVEVVAVVPGTEGQELVVAAVDGTYYLTTSINVYPNTAEFTYTTKEAKNNTYVKLGLKNLIDYAQFKDAVWNISRKNAKDVETVAGPACHNTWVPAAQVAMAYPEGQWLYLRDDIFVNRESGQTVSIAALRSIAGKTNVFKGMQNTTYTFTKVSAPGDVKIGYLNGYSDDALKQKAFRLGTPVKATGDTVYIARGENGNLYLSKEVSEAVEFRLTKYVFKDGDNTTDVIKHFTTYASAKTKSGFATDTINFSKYEVRDAATGHALAYDYDNKKFILSSSSSYQPLVFKNKDVNVYNLLQSVYGAIKEGMLDDKLHFNTDGELDYVVVDPFEYEYSPEYTETIYPFCNASKLYGAHNTAELVSAESAYNFVQNDLFVLTDADAMQYVSEIQGDTIKLFRHEDSNYVVYEKKGFLGLENFLDPTYEKKNPAILADNGAGKGTWRPEYLLTVEAEYVTDGWTCPFNPEHNTAKWQEEHGGHCADAVQDKPYMTGRYLVALGDSSAAAIKAGKEDIFSYQNYSGQKYYKLAFVPAIHIGDSLIINSTKDTIDVVSNAFESVKPCDFAFHYTDANRTAFIIETAYGAVNEDGTYAQGYIKYHNGMPVVTAQKSDAEVFELEQTSLIPTSNDSVENSASAISVIANDGTVTIQGAAGKSVVISNILGKVVAETVLSSDNATIAVPAGIVAVAVEGEAAVKVVVK